MSRSLLWGLVKFNDFSDSIYQSVSEQTKQELIQLFQDNISKLNSISTKTQEEEEIMSSRIGFDPVRRNLKRFEETSQTKSSLN